MNKYYDPNLSQETLETYQGYSLQVFTSGRIKLSFTSLTDTGMSTTQYALIASVRPMPNSPLLYCITDCFPHIL